MRIMKNYENLENRYVKDTLKDTQPPFTSVFETRSDGQFLIESLPVPQGISANGYDIADENASNV